MRFREMTIIAAGFAALALASAPAGAATWTPGAWAASPQEVGRCRLDMDGKARRMETRSLSCRAPGGESMREEDCDATTRPQATRWLSCSMQWSCTDWHPGVYAEGARTKAVSYRPATTTRVGAAVACTNAKEGDPSGVHSCRASLIDGMVEELPEAPLGMSSNANYAWISCARVAR